MRAHTIEVRVVAVSSNTNSFGLHSVVLFAKDGRAYQTLSNDLSLPLRGGSAIFAVDDNGRVSGTSIALQGWETLTELPKPSADVFKAGWKGAA